MIVVEEGVEQVRAFASAVRENVHRVIIGQDRAIDFILVALLTGGHVLLEDVPGTGKTMLARALALSLGLEFRRLQCTPDLLPSDVTGVSVFNQKTREFEFHPGPVFTHILLADEINRATPRTQSALLEAMAETQVTVDGVTHPLRRPFLVIATQNPIEYEGTFPLPEAQLDRFMLKTRLGYLSPDQEEAMLLALRRQHPIETLEPVVDGREIPRLAEIVWEVRVDETVRHYMVALIQATRTHPDLALGASPRGSLALYKGSQALAALHGRDYVLPDDVKAMARVSLPHRCIVSPEAALRNKTADQVMETVLESVPLDLGEVV